jgi:hypothetical protein
MRLNTSSKYRNFVFIYIILILMLAFDLFVVSVETGTIGQTELRLGYFVLVIVLFLAYRGNPVFTYDSDGEVILLDSKNPSLSFLSRSFSQHYEFPKRKLVGYDIQRWPFRKALVLKVSSKDGKRKHITAACSYLSKQDLKDLERSLRGILSKNKKAGFLEENYEDNDD